MIFTCAGQIVVPNQLPCLEDRLVESGLGGAARALIQEPEKKAVKGLSCPVSSLGAVLPRLLVLRRLPRPRFHHPAGQLLAPVAACRIAPTRLGDYTLLIEKT